MSVTGGAIPEANIEPSICAIETKKICSSPNELTHMKNFMAEIFPNFNVDKMSDNQVIRELIKYLRVNSEAEIWEHKEFKEFVGENKAMQVLRRIFKPAGPSDSTALLDNWNIDNTLHLWSLHAKVLFHKKFKHIPFQMIDFATIKQNDVSLADEHLWKTLQEGYDCFGVVLNTDISSGGGKHWFCIYGDFQHAGTRDDPYTLEYFNSSGNPPVQEVSVWMEDEIHQLLRDYKKHCDIIRSANKRLQYSNTECGVWSLMYIKSRLQGHPPNWFYTVKADDQDMIDLRKHLFRKSLHGGR